MKDPWLSGHKQEVERCLKIYSDFTDGAGFVKAVFESVNTRLGQHSSAFSLNEVTALLPAEASALLKNNVGLALEPPIDKNLFYTLFHDVCSVVVQTNPALKKNIAHVLKMADNFFAKEETKVSIKEINKLQESILKEDQIAEDLATLIFTTIQSSICIQQLEPVKKMLHTDLYEGGECPVCGRSPHYGLLHPANGAKRLECWLCGTRWVHPRAKCPYCGNENREGLGYFTVEGNDICRVHYCQACCCYYKVYDVRAFAADEDVVLSVHNLASLDYDLLAGKEGFLPGSGLKWVSVKELT